MSGFVPSIYNLQFKKTGSVFLYNILSKAYLKLDNSERYGDFSWLGNATTKILKCDEKKFEPRWNSIPEKFKTALLSGHFVIPSNADEIGYLSFQNKLSRYSTAVLQITILLTYACNLRCTYCYEKNAPEKNVLKITNDTSKNLLRFIRRRLEEGAKTVHATWYGGEPMLCYNEMRSLSKKIIALCKHHKTKY